MNSSDSAAMDRIAEDLFGGRPDDAVFAERPAVIGKYVVRREIGHGGSAVVYEAHDPELNRTVAVKVLGGATGRSLLARFHREAVIAAGLRHPGIVAVHDYGLYCGSPYIVMEHVDGNPLSSWMGGRPLPEILRLLEEAARAIHFAHSRGVLHRDVKPQNILVASDGTVRVADFGLARPLSEEEDRMTQSGAILGTPAYMSPEQAQGNIGALDARTDVYALGVIAYEAATGRRPHAAESVAAILQKIHSEEPVPPGRVNRTISPDLEAVIERAVEKDPRRRYPSALAFANDLRRFLLGEPTLARPRGFAERLLRRIRRRRGGAVAAGLLLLGATVVGLSLRRASQAERSNRELAQRVAEAPREANALDALRGRAVTRHHHGRRLAESGGDPTAEYRASLEDLDAVLRANPLHARALCERADVHLSLARSSFRHGRDPRPELEAAEADCLEAVRSNEREAEARRLRGDIALVRSELEVENAAEWYRIAELAYTEAIVPEVRFQRARMDRAKVRALRARMRKEAGEDPASDFATAEDDCSESLRHAPRKAELWTWRAGLRREMAADREARGATEEARRLSELAASDQQEAERLRTID